MVGLKHESSASSIAALIAVVILVVDLRGVSASRSMRSARRLLILDIDRGWNAAAEGPRFSGRFGDGEGGEIKGLGFEAGNSNPDFALPEFGGDEDDGRGQGNNKKNRNNRDEGQEGSREEKDRLPIGFANFLMNTFFP